MKNCPFTSTPGEPKLCSPDCVFYDTESGDCGLLEIVNVLKDIKEKSVELRESLFDINNTWKSTQENIKDLKPDENITERLSSIDTNMTAETKKIRETIELIPLKIENYRNTSETLIDLVKKSNSLLDELKHPQESPELTEMIELLKGSITKLSEIKDRINIENAFKELEKSEKDFFDTLAVDLNNSIEKNQALLIENLSSYLTTTSTNLEKILTEPNYTKILDYLKKTQDENISAGERFVKSLEETLEKNQKDLITSFDSYFSSLKEEISTLPSSVSEIENFIKSNNVVDFLRDKETRENELANILLANVSNILSKNQQSLMESLSIYINSMTSAINTIPDSLSSLENSVKAANVTEYLKEKETRDKAFSEETSKKIITAIESNRESLFEILSSRLGSIDLQFKSLPQSIESLQGSVLQTSSLEFLKEKESRDRQFFGNHLINLAQFLQQSQKGLLTSLDSYFSSLKEEISTLPSSVSEIENFIKSNNVVDFLRDKETRENELANILLANVSNILSKNQQSLMESLSIYINSMTSAINTIPDSLSSLENSVKAANVTEYLKEKETRDKDHIEKTNQSLIQSIENAKNEMSKISSDNQILLGQKISEIIETIKTSGDNQEIKELLTQISINESSLGTIFTENTSNLTERYSKDLSDSFDRLIQNLIPVSKMSVQGIMEIRDEIKQNTVKMISEKEKRDRLFIKEAMSRWIEAYAKEQNSFFSVISGLKTDIEDIRQSLTSISQGSSWTKLVEFMENYVKSVTLAESKKIQMLMDFREIVSSKILPHLHNISTIANLQKQGTDTSVQLFNSLAQQNEMMVNSNREMTQMIQEASGSISKAFSSIGSLIESQRQSVENLNSLSEKLESILVKQIEVFEREEKNLKTLEKESNRSKAMTHNDRGVGFYHTKQFNAAIKEFQKATELAPELHEPYLNLGIVFAEIGEMNKAKNLFTKVIEMSPETVEAYINLGLLYVFDEKFDQAENLIKESLKFSPNYSRSLSALGEIYFKMKKYDLAEGAWQKAVDVNPLDEEALRGLKQLRGEDIAE